MRLDGVRIRGLTQDLQQCRVRHEEKPREQQPLLLQVPVENVQILEQKKDPFVLDGIVAYLSWF